MFCAVVLYSATGFFAKIKKYNFLKNFYILELVVLCSNGWPGIYCIDQVGLELTM